MLALTENKQGFTIIEVVLVLAIAGLIFLMVFVALPSLQRSQRDTARRNDMSRVSTSLTQYITNHSSSANKLPVSGGHGSWYDATTKLRYGPPHDGYEHAEKFILEYMNSGSGNTSVNEFKDPDGTPYNMLISTSISDGNPPTAVTTPAKFKNGKTANSWTIDSDFDDHIVYIIPGAKCQGEDFVKSQANNFAVLYRLEGAGVFCIDDQ